MKKKMFTDQKNMMHRLGVMMLKEHNIAICINLRINI